MTQLKPLRSRRFSYFRDLRLGRGGLRVVGRETEIPLNLAFFRSVFAVLRLDAHSLIAKTHRILRGLKPAATIAFYPDRPSRWFNIHWVAHFANLRTVDDVDLADHIFVFDDATFSPVETGLTPSQRARAINIHAEDISKRHVGEVFEEVFGYPLTVDPTRYEGVAICKSDTNGAHDGSLVNCPISPEAVDPEQAYQRLVDSTFDGATSEDLRFAYAFGAIPVVFHKRKRISERFGTNYLQVDLRAADDVFTSAEQALLKKFCHRMGLDFGAVDAMRDKQDGRLYVVDVNKTCMPVLSLSLGDQIDAMRAISAAFVAGIESEDEDQGRDAGRVALAS